MENEEGQLQLEFEWILEKEVHEVLNHVRQILRRCAQRFRGGELVKPEKFVLKSILGGDNLKCVVTLLGEVIYEAGRCHRVRSWRDETSYGRRAQSVLTLKKCLTGAE